MSTPVPVPDKPEPAIEQSPAVRTAPQIGSTLLGGLTARSLMVMTGLGFICGFFMPWITLGNAAQVSGLGLLTTSGEIVDLVSGPYQFLIFSVPLLGVGLLAGGFTGRSFAPWFAVASGVLIMVGGLYTALRTFLSATGLGMWIVVASALVSLIVGLLTVGRSR